MSERLMNKLKVKKTPIKRQRVKVKLAKDTSVLEKVASKLKEFTDPTKEVTQASKEITETVGAALKLEPIDEDTDHCVVIVHTENYVYPRGWMAQLEMDEDTPIITANSSMRKLVVEGAQSVHDADVTMWKYIANIAINSLLRGCRTLALPLFIGALIFQ